MVGAVIISAVILFIGIPVWTGLYVWHNASMVGGEWWPYIRIVVSVIGGILVFKAIWVVVWIVVTFLGLTGAVLDAIFD